VTENQPIGSPDAIERSLGLPGGMLMRLLNDGDDWSFMIQGHALVEAAVNHLLVATLACPSISEAIAHLELSNVRTGKLALVAQMDLLPKPHRRFVRAFSELRNTLVHDVQKVGFRFDEYLGAMSPEQRKAFRESFGGIFSQSSGPRRTAFRRMTDASPRLLVWSSLLIVVALCYASKELAELGRKKAELDSAIAEHDSDSTGLAKALMQEMVAGLSEHGHWTVRVAKQNRDRAT